MSEFFRSCLSVVARRGWFLVVLNWLFFGFVVVGALLVEAGVVEVFAWPFGGVFPVGAGNALFLFGFIFFNNLVLSGFMLVTLTGFVFFGLGAFFLGFRGLLWGMLFSMSSTSTFLVALPTLILEGEGYVLAALAGVVLGLSWLKPRWVYGEAELSRSEAVKRALNECVRVYVLVALILLVAGVVETVTLVYV